ncbi:hypothetical protein M8C21_028626 [Ambrosia artemisiifolia]|uniref:BHLH domain-containing protein n=1 Tax=Ambrosia artemisiifolia TaxID=4212 RepID=A0AAD5G446_AMBAR|nr:hypothetical protein M8C21_028626 [Ambrosia artemisiifolia]
MFSSFQHSREIYFRTPSTSNQHLHNHPIVTTSSSSSVGGVPNPTTPSNRRLSGRKRSHNNSKSQLIMDHEQDIEKKKKRMEHKEVERKRRQDMASLCSSLRSLLPLHLIKGRRSMSEHMNQAVNYIKHLQQNIKRLNTKREELKKTCRSVTDSSSISKNNIKSETLTVGCNRNLVTVTISCSHGEVVILIRSYTEQKGILISRVVEALLQEGLDVISCNSTKVNDRLIHSIQSQVIDETTSIQVSMLQQKLTELVNTPS